MKIAVARCYNRIYILPDIKNQEKVWSETQNYFFNYPYQIFEISVYNIQIHQDY